MSDKILVFKQESKPIKFNNKILSKAVNYCKKKEKHTFVHILDEYLRIGAITHEDIRKLEEYLESKLSENDATLTFFLANLYHRAYNGPKFKRAKELYERAISLGSYEAMTNLGIMYQLGDGVPVDYDKAIELYEKAGVEDKEGLHNLGCLYYEGAVYPQDLAMARMWFERAAEKDNAHSAYNLAKMYHMGEGVSKNLIKAKDYYELAANLGEPSAFYELGAMHANGEGCQVDLDMALKYFTLAKRFGIKEATAAIAAVQQEKANRT